MKRPESGGFQMRQLRPPTRSGCPSVCPAPPARKPGFGGPSQPPGGLFRKPSVQERHGDSDVKDHAALRTARAPSGLWLWSPTPHVAHGARPGPAGGPRTCSLLDPAGPTPASSAPPTAGPEETRPSRAPGPRPAPPRRPCRAGTRTSPCRSRGAVLWAVPSPQLRSEQRHAQRTGWKRRGTHPPSLWRTTQTSKHTLSPKRTRQGPQGEAWVRAEPAQPWTA